MRAEQNMTQTITQTAIESAKAALITNRNADNPVNTASPVQVMLRTEGPALKPPTFGWKAT